MRFKRKNSGLKRPCHFFPAASLLFVFLALLVSSCGKKGEPTLKSFEKPIPPSLSGVVHREGEIILSWSFSKNRETEIAGFHILRSSGSGFHKVASEGSDKRSYTDTDFSLDIPYTYKIVSQNHRGILSNDSNSVTLTPSTPPLPPKNISFTVPDDSVILSWENRGEGILFNVYKRFAGGTYGTSPVNKTPLSGGTFTDILIIDKPVYYVIRSLTTNEWRDEGPSSEEVTVDPSALVPPPPEDVRYFSTPDKVYLYWNEPDHIWITRFRVYRRIAGGDYVLIGETQIPTFLDAEKPLTKRDYRVNAVGPEKEGPGTEIKDVVFVPE